MKFQKTPVALAAFALLAAAPFAAQGAPSVSFKKPDAGATLSNVNIYQSSGCEVTGSNIKRVVFSIVSSTGATTGLNTELSAPWNCNLNSKNFKDGSYTLRAVAYDSANKSATATRGITIKNNTTSGSTSSTNTPPSVSLTSPGNGATVSGTSVSCAANASDSNGIKHVQFYIDGAGLSTDTASPYACTFDSTKYANGTHTLKAVATDTLGATSSTQISFNINNTTANAKPVVTFTTPANGANLPAGSASWSGGFKCVVTASDSDGIKQVQWFLDNTLLATELSAPYDSCNLDTTKFSPGAHQLRAVATDNKGATGEAQVTVNIGGATNTPPSVSLASPSNGGTVSGTSVSCAANASDGNGIRDVQFSIDGVALSTDTASPYACTFDSTKYANGTHTLRAVATDTLGASSSTQISFSISNAAANAKPVVTFTTPANGANLPAGSASWSGGFSCVVTASDSDGIKQVQWFLDNTLLGTELKAPYDSCNLDTTKFSPGAHLLRAVATDNKDAIGEAQITVNLGTSGTTNTPPTVSLTAPAAGQTLSGTAVPYQATASDTGGSVKKVELYLAPSTQTLSASTISASTQTPVATHTTAPYQGTFDSTKQPNGAYTLMAVATDDLGATATTQRSVTISNLVPNPTPTPTPNPDPNPAPGMGTTLPSTNAKAVATFESLGVYWKPASAPSDGSCTVRYRKASESEFKEGLPMWFDPRNVECRGSIVHLAPGTDYVVEMGLPGKSPEAGLNTKTWSENFPIARTVQVASGSGTLNITEGGTPSGYVLYTGPATLDANNAVDFNVTISAPYVIVRGLTLKGARRDGIRILKPAHDVVIEDNDISEWGRWSGTVSLDGWKIQTDGDSGIAGNCWGTEPWLERTIIQRNKIHHPRYGSNSWSGTVGLSNKHPKGANGVWLNDCGGNHVWRYNEVYSDWGRYFMDGFGGWENHSSRGTPNSDSDIYGNIIRHAWDDAIESEGANNNVRIWGNYMDQTATAVATTSSVKGPVYIFRNVWNRSRNLSMSTLDADSRLYMFKSGSSTGGDGRRYVFHNTMLQAPPPAGSVYPQGGGQGLAGPGGGQNLTNTVSRNNLFHIWKSWWSSVYDNGGGGTPNNLDYDLVNGGVTAYPGAEPNRIVGTPTYKAGHGWANEAGGNYQLDSSSAGYDRATKLPNFNDSFTGAAPDMGAHEADTPAMRLGVNGSGGTWAGPTGGGTTTGGTTTGGTTTDGTTTDGTTTGGTTTGGTTTDGSTSTTSGTTTTTTSSGGVCSTVWCAATQ